MPEFALLRPACVTLLAIFLLCQGLACSQTPVIDTDRASLLAAIPYPAGAKDGPSLDIVVERKGKRIELTNREPDVYVNMQLWLNRQYLHPVDRLEIGSGNVFELHQFINQFQEPFPTGTWLSPDKGRPVVIAELYDPITGVRYPLLTYPEK